MVQYTIFKAYLLASLLFLMTIYGASAQFVTVDSPENKVYESASYPPSISIPIDITTIEVSDWIKYKLNNGPNEDLCTNCAAFSDDTLLTDLAEGDYTFTGYAFYDSNLYDTEVQFTIDYCVPDWICGGYGNCKTDDTSACTTAFDMKKCHSFTRNPTDRYSGDYSEFSQGACDYCNPSWYCSLYDGCSDEDRKACLAVSDSRECYQTTGLASDQTFTGNFDDLEAGCDFCDPDWECSGYSTCQIIGTEELLYCNDATDSTGCYDQTGLPDDQYSGDYSEFENIATDCCTPNWACVGYGACNSDDKTHCTTVFDTETCHAWTRLASDRYAGDYSEFSPLDCNYYNLHAPVLDPIADVEVDVGQIVTIPVSAFDPDSGDTLTYGIDHPSFTFDGANFIWHTTADDHGTFNLLVFVSDSEALTDSESFTLTVNECVWSCGSWSSCSGRSQTRTCTDNGHCSEVPNPHVIQQSCGGGGGGSSSSRSSTIIIPSCDPDWQCSAWSACGSNSRRQRTCSDLNDCSEDDAKPVETEDCVYNQPTQPSSISSGPIPLPEPEIQQPASPQVVQQPVPQAELEPLQDTAPSPITGQAVTEIEPLVGWKEAILIIILIAILGFDVYYFIFRKK